MVIERNRSSSGLQLARVLLADDDPAARLAVQTVLEAGGYRVDSAASAAEAVGKLDDEEYELVLTDIDMEFPDSGLKVIAHARMMDYKPATAVLRTESNAEAGSRPDRSRALLVAPENLPEFLAQVASLISYRATRKLERQMRHQAAVSWS